MSDSSSGCGSASEAQLPPDDDIQRWRDHDDSVGGGGGGSLEAEADDDQPPEPSACSLTRVDSLTLALKALQAGGLHVHSQDNAANSDNSLGSSRSGSGSHLEHEPRPPCKRASSLKIPRRNDPSSPDSATKKAVRFADAMGLDLALVRHVFDLESPPEIPPAATRDLVLPPSDDEDQEGGDDQGFSDATQRQQQQQQQQVPVSLYLSPSFAQPGSAPNFNSRITLQKVVLERAQFHQQSVASSACGAEQQSSSRSAASIIGGQVRGYVRVANLGFEKSVRIRASLDNWSSSFDVCADYVAAGSCAGSDQFSFAMSLPEWLRAGDRIVFCVAYSVNGETYWDNNFGDNYAFHCVPVGSAPRPGLDQAWSRYV